MRESKDVLAVCCGYAAAVIGAGFASGQEIVSFFVRYGRAGIIGIAVSCTVFALFAYSVLSVCITLNVRSGADFLAAVFPRAYMRKAASAALIVCSLAGICVMTACAGEVCYTLTGAGKFIASAVFSFVCMAVFVMDARRLLQLNSILGAIIVFGIIFSCFYILRFREHQTFSPSATAAASGIAYAGYNLVSAYALLAGMSHLTAGKREAAVASTLSGVILFIMITLIWGVLGIYYGKINLGEIPMITMAFRQNKIFGLFYGLMLIIAVLTTALSNGFAFMDAARAHIPERLSAVIAALTGFCMSGAGFANLVNILYRICGWCGAVIVFAIIIYGIKISKIQNKREKESKTE